MRRQVGRRLTTALEYRSKQQPLALLPTLTGRRQTYFGLAQPHRLEQLPVNVPVRRQTIGSLITTDGATRAVAYDTVNFAIIVPGFCQVPLYPCRH